MWNALQHTPWNEFHEVWWGKPWEENLAQPLLVQEFICEKLGILQGTDGFLFQRAEYRAFANRIRNAKAKLSYYQLWGCLLLGQPGIGEVEIFSAAYLLSTFPGKSVFLLFFLLICISKEETVLFTNSTGSTFLIYKEGVLEKPTAQFTIDDLSPSTTRIWSLVDSPQGKVPLPSSVTSAYPSRVFFVAAVSLDISRYKEIAKGRVSIWWMSAWKDEELFTLYVPCGLTDRFVTDLRPLSRLNHSPLLSNEKRTVRNPSRRPISCGGSWSLSP